MDRSGQWTRWRSVVALVLGVVAVGAVLLVGCDPGGGGGGGAPTTSVRPGCAPASLPTTVAYRTVPGVPRDAISLDVHAPAGACRAPVVMWVHGGGYHVGDKANQVEHKKALFNARGWIFVSVNYRLTVVGDPRSAHFPDHYQDVAAAVAWVHGSIGRYGGDPGRIALLGHSAGADIVSNVGDDPTYLRAHGLPLSTLDCIGPLDTEGFDKVAASQASQAQWESALGNEPAYRTITSATRFVTATPGLPDTIGVFRGSALRQQIEKAYLATVASKGASTATIDARALTHEEVNARIGAPGDQVMTPPLVAFLTTCLG